MSLSLAILLALLGAWAIWREKTWRARVSKVTSAAGLRDFQSDALATRFASLQESNQSLLKEEYLRRLFEALLSEIRQGVAIVDNHMRIKFVNRTLAHLFQKNDIQRGRTLFEEIQDHQIIDVVQSALKDQRRIVREVEFTTLSGSSITSRHYLIEASPLPAKAESGAWLMVHDITEQTMAEQIRKTSSPMLPMNCVRHSL
jgi:two-component system, OmpR family, phosphate regulon sensor histidine kinase PhoR